MHIAFEGPIGAGKTTLASIFSSHIGAKISLEDFEGNKFLSDFYHDRERWGLAMQLWFLTSRHDQLSKLGSANYETFVTDHSLSKDKVFAHMLLAGRELELYERVSDTAHKTIKDPTVVVLLDARNDVLLKRISQRARSYEIAITSQYLDDLRHSYETNFPFSRSAVVRIDTSDLDLTSETQLHELFALIQTAATQTT